jgi:hypothetical protein
MGIKRAVYFYGPRMGSALDFDYFTTGIMAAILTDVMGKVLFAAVGANDQMARLQ